MNKQTETGFTLIELLVVIAIISLLVSILLPSLRRAKELARQVLCMSNHRQLTHAVYLYSGEFNEHFPYAWSNFQCINDGKPISIEDALKFSLGGAKDVWKCPSDRPISGYPDGVHGAYGASYNYNSDRYWNGHDCTGLQKITLSHISQPNEIVLFWDAANFHTQSGFPETHSPVQSDGDGFTSSFVDAHVEVLTYHELRYYVSPK